MGCTLRGKTREQTLVSILDAKEGQSNRRAKEGSFEERSRGTKVIRTTPQEGAAFVQCLGGNANLVLLRC